MHLNIVNISRKNKVKDLFMHLPSVYGIKKKNVTEDMLNHYRLFKFKGDCEKFE